MDSPIKQMPEEILGEIFYRCSLHCADAPIVCSAVSRIFRRVALNTPRIWRRLRLSPPRQADWVSVHKADLWFAMSGVCLVDVYVDMSKPSSQPLGTLGTVLSNDDRQVPLVQALLNRHSSKIRSLALRTTTEAQAQPLFTSLYVPSENSSLLSPCPPPLRKLTFHVTAVDLNNAAHPTTESMTDSPLSQLLPSLACLKLTNHTLRCLPIEIMHNLTTLTIIRPLRAPPLAACSIFLALRTAHKLEHFELDSRVDLHDDQPLPPIHTAAPDDPEADSESGMIDSPSLVQVTLRMNNMPALLSRLVVPQLRTLSLKDLDGNRAGGAEEMGKALRGILVRMHLPDAAGRSGFSGRPERGIQEFEIDYVPVHRRRPGEEELWEWCFRRMTTLCKLIAVNTNTEEVFGMLLEGSQLQYPVLTPAGAMGNDEQILPNLEYISVSDAELSSSMRRFFATRPRIAFHLGDQGSCAGPSLHGTSPIMPTVENSTPSIDTAPRERSMGIGGFGFGSHFDLSRRNVVELKTPKPMGCVVSMTSGDEEDW